MLAGELITLLGVSDPDWSRERLREFVNYVHRIMMSHPTAYNRVLDGTTGSDPKITPTQIVTAISGASWIDIVYEGEDCSCPVDVVIHRGTITFKEEQLNQEYSVRYYGAPTEILTENTELDVPDEYIHYLESGVEAYIEKKESKNPMNWEKWLSNKLVKFQYRINRQYKFRLGDETNDTEKGYTSY